VELFLCKRAMHFCFQNASHLFCSFDTLWAYHEKRKKKKKGTSLWCFMLGNARGVRCSRIKHPPKLVQVSTFFFWRENA
jgi:hypothetical protein